MSISLTGAARSRGTAPPVVAGALALPDRLALWLVLLPLCLDYRFPNPNSVTLAIYAVTSILSVAGALMLAARSGLYNQSSANWSAAIAGALAFVAIADGLLRGQDLAQVVRLAPPLVLCCSAIVATSALRAAGADPRSVWRQALIAAVIGMVMQVVLAMAIEHIKLATVRYQVLSSAAPLVWGYFDGLILFGGWTLAAAPILAIHLGTVLVSVTRTQIVVGVLPALIAVIVTRGRLLMRKNTVVGLLIAVIAAAGALSVGATVADSPISRWEQRLFSQSEHHGYDVTALTRTGEAKFQLRAMGADPVGLFTGFGVAAPTTYDPETAALIQHLVGNNVGYWSEWGFGHNHYVGTLFVGGVIFGGAFLLMQLRVLFCAALAIGRLSRPEYVGRYRTVLNFPLAYLGCCAFGTLGALLASRGSGVVLGITLGMVLWIYEATKPSQSRPT